MSVESPCSKLQVYIRAIYTRKNKTRLTQDASYLSHEHTRINGQFVHCRTLVATNVKPPTDEQVFLDKFLDEFTYPYVQRTSFPRQVFLDKLYLFVCTAKFDNILVVSRQCLPIQYGPTTEY